MTNSVVPSRPDSQNGLMLRTDAERLVKQFVESPQTFASAREVLDRYPGLFRHHSLTMDLVYEEYCRAREAGEEIVPSQFARRFPEVEQSLCRVFEFDSVLHEHPSLVEAFPDASWPKPGTEFSGFRLIEKIGRGGLSCVYLAQEPSVGDRIVVVKVCVRGEQEAGLLGKLEHPGIAKVYSAKTEDVTGLAVICMPFETRITLHHLAEDLWWDLKRRSGVRSGQTPLTTPFVHEENSPEPSGGSSGEDCVSSVTDSSEVSRRPEEVLPPIDCFAVDPPRNETGTFQVAASDLPTGAVSLTAQPEIETVIQEADRRDRLRAAFERLTARELADRIREMNSPISPQANAGSLAEAQDSHSAEVNRAEEDRADDDRAEEEAFAVAGFSPDDRLSTVIVRWGIQIAEALAFAHKRRVLHCDVKPGNVLLMNNLRARLLDFNLAVSADSPLVLQGGTLPYMASEQLAMLINALGQEQPDDRTVVTCSTATDVFGTCATLWQLATGTPPFGDAIDLKSRGLAARLLMERQRFGVSAEQLEAIRSVLPDGVVQVLLKGLTFDPCDRISTASELAGLLKEQLPQCPVRAAHENSALWSRGGLAAMTCLLVVSFAFVMTALSSGPQSERNLSSTGDRTTNTDPAVRRTAEAHLMASQGRFEEALEVLAGLSSKSPLDRVLELYCRTCTVPKLVLSGLDDSANVPPPPESYTSAETWETWARLAAEWQSISASEAVLSNTELGNCCRWNLGVIQLELLNLDAAAEAFASCDCRYGSPEQSEFAQHFVDWQRGRMAGLPPDPDRLRRMIDLIPQTSSRGMSLTVICLLCDLTEVADDATHVISSSEVFQLLNTMSGRFAEPGALNLIKNARGYFPALGRSLNRLKSREAGGSVTGLADMQQSLCLPAGL